MAGKPAKSMIGEKHGMLTVIGRAGSCGGHAMWLCECDCGGSSVVVGQSLRTGHTKSCGCQMQAARMTFVKKFPDGRQGVRHGLSKSKSYNSWTAMRKRCTKQDSRDWPHYGGRGIRVCDRWQEFANFYEDMGEKPSLRHSIDRIDNDGNYEPGNCRWATPEEQAANRSR